MSTTLTALLIVWTLLAGNAFANDKGSQLAPGQSLMGNSNDELSSGFLRFVMQHDCNLVVYHGFPARAMWSTSTHGKGQNCRAIMQGDGNLVIYRGSDNKAVWASGTHRNPGAYLVAQMDGNVVIYKGTKALWATNTDDRPTSKAATRPSKDRYQGCAFARTETNCIVAVMMCRAVYSCGMLSLSSPDEKKESWKPCGVCKKGGV